MQYVVQCIQTIDTGVEMFAIDVQNKEACRAISDRYGKDNISPLVRLISSGNTKLPSTTCVFNMGSAHSCPSMALGLCSAMKAGVKCYAIKAEYSFHPQCRPYRDRQEKFWKSISGKDFVTQFLFLNALKRVPFTALRLNESGDFWSQECVDKAEYIATELSKFGIKTYCYTSRKDLDYSKVQNLIINGSGFTKAGIVNEFKIVNKGEKIQGYGKCAGDCSICNRCQHKGMKTIVEKH